SFLSGHATPRPGDEFVVPIGSALGRSAQHDLPAFACVGFETALSGNVAAGIVIDEEMELSDALRDRDEPEALVAQRCPARDVGEGASGKRALDAFGEAKLAIPRCDEPDR